LEYNAFIRDCVSRKGAVGGLKVIVNDVVLSAGKLGYAPLAPVGAYLKAPSGKNNARSIGGAQASDQPGSLLVRFPIDDLFIAIYDEMARTNRIDVVFSRRVGTLDIGVPLDLTVKETNNLGQRTRSPEAVQGFLQCVSSLLR
jgi:hypothetical protein